MNKIKPCPFCGMTPKILQFKGEYAIACMNEKCIFEVMTHVFGTKTEAVKEWNTRAGERKEATKIKYRFKIESPLVGNWILWRMVNKDFEFPQALKKDFEKATQDFKKNVKELNKK